MATIKYKLIRMGYLSLSLAGVCFSKKKKNSSYVILCFIQMDSFEDCCDSFDGGSARSNVQDSDSFNNNAVVITQVGKRRRKLTSHVWN